jgi:3-hydroxybutyryl-CoA dehydrogenase
LPITVAIIGAGPLGRRLALAAARAGFRVLLEDVMPANLHLAQEQLGRELGPEQARVAESATDDLGERAEGSGVRFVSTVEDAVREADLAIDCVPDELESKLEILCLLDRMAPPRTVIATPTTQLSIADLAACTYRAEKCVGIFAAPAELNDSSRNEIMIRTTKATSAETVALTRAFWERLGYAVRFEADPAE